MILKQILTMVAVLVLLSSVAGAAVSSGSVTRSLSTSSALPNGNITVTLTPSPPSLFTVYQVTETLPGGFTYVRSTADNVSVTGQQLVFTRIGSSPISYVVSIPSTEGSYTFSGSFKDGDRNSGSVGGASRLSVSGRSAGNVERSLSAQRVSPGVNVTVTLTPSPSDLFNSPGYQVSETIPAGFIVSTTATVTNAGNVYTFTQMGSGAITYVLTAPAATGDYSINGSFKDEINAVGTVSGSSAIAVEDVVAEYRGADNMVSKDEAVLAVLDFFGGKITRDDAVRVVIAFFMS